MVDKSTAIKTVLERLKKMAVCHCLDLRSYKRDRSILIIKEGLDVYRVIENGFYSEIFEARGEDLRSLLKKIIKREFPRSHKLRIYMLGLYKRGESESYAPGKI